MKYKNRRRKKKRYKNHSMMVDQIRPRMGVINSPRIVIKILIKNLIQFCSGMNGIFKGGKN